MENLKKDELIEKLLKLGIASKKETLETLKKEDLIDLLESYEIRESIEQENFENKYLEKLKSYSVDQVTKEMAEKLHEAVVQKRKVLQENNEIKSKVKSLAAEFLRTLK